jgi:hypothetical protein
MRINVIGKMILRAVNYGGQTGLGGASTLSTCKQLRCEEANSSIPASHHLGIRLASKFAGCYRVSDESLAVIQIRKLTAGV